MHFTLAVGRLDASQFPTHAIFLFVWWIKCKLQLRTKKINKKWQDRPFIKPTVGCLWLILWKLSSNHFCQTRRVLQINSDLASKLLAWGWWINFIYNFFFSFGFWNLKILCCLVCSRLASCLSAHLCKHKAQSKQFGHNLEFCMRAEKVP